MGITHATSIVSSSGDGNGACYDWVPYAACLDCLAAYTKTATANIDLRGTPFRVASEFKYDGHKASGSVTYSHNRQVVELAGGGHCGYTATVEAIDDRAVDNKPGGWYLQLERIVDCAVTPGSWMITTAPAGHTDIVGSTYTVDATNGFTLPYGYYLVTVVDSKCCLFAGSDSQACFDPSDPSTTDTQVTWNKPEGIGAGIWVHTRQGARRRNTCGQALP